MNIDFYIAFAYLGLVLLGWVLGLAHNELFVSIKLAAASFLALSVILKRLLFVIGESVRE